MKTHRRGNKQAAECIYLLTAGDGKGPAELPDMRRESSISRILCEFGAESRAQNVENHRAVKLLGQILMLSLQNTAMTYIRSCHCSRAAEDLEGLQNKLQIRATFSALYRCHLLPVCLSVGLFCSSVQEKCHSGSFHGDLGSDNKSCRELSSRWAQDPRKTLDVYVDLGEI